MVDIISKAELRTALENDNWQAATKALAAGAVPDEEMLEYAVSHRHVDWLELLLDAGAKPTPDMLHIAVTQAQDSSDYGKTELLLRAGMKPKWQTRRFVHKNLSSRWDNLVLYAARNPYGSIEAAELHNAVLIGDFEGAKISASEVVPDDETLLLAIRRLDAKWVQMLTDARVKSGVKPNEWLLLNAVTEKSEPKADILIKAGAVPDDRTMNYAVGNLDAGFMKKLIAALPKAESYLLDTVVQLGKQKDVAAALIAKGALPDADTLSRAVGYLDAEWVQTLLDAGAKPVSDMIYSAMNRNDKEIAAILIAAGAVPDERVLQHATDENAEWMEMLLEAAKAGKTRPTPDMLHNAVRRDAKDTAALLIAEGVVPTADTLNYAISSRDAAWVELLLDAGAEATTDMLYRATSNAKEDIARALVDKGGVMPNQDTMSSAVNNRTSRWVKMLVEAGGEPTADMLNRAVTREKRDMAEALIGGGAVPNDDTLHYAVNNMTASWVSLLMEAGATPTADMLYNAVYKGKWALIAPLAEHVVPSEETLKCVVSNSYAASWVKTLIDAGAQPTAQMLQTAAYKGKWDIVAALAVKVAPNDETMKYAVSNQDVDAIRKLVQAGGRATPELLYNAVYRQQWAMVDVLAAGGAKPNEQTLSHAITNLTADWVEKLLDAGGKPTAEMLHAAVYRGREDTARLLIAHGAVPEEKTVEYAERNRDADWADMLKAAKENKTTVVEFNKATAKQPPKPQPLEEKAPKVLRKSVLVKRNTL